MYEAGQLLVSHRALDAMNSSRRATHDIMQRGEDEFDAETDERSIDEDEDELGAADWDEGGEVVTPDLEGKRYN